MALRRIAEKVTASIRTSRQWSSIVKQSPGLPFLEMNQVLRLSAQFVQLPIRIVTSAVTGYTHSIHLLAVTQDGDLSDGKTAIELHEWLRDCHGHHDQ